MCTRKSGSPDEAYLNYIINWVNDLAKKDPDGISPPMVSRYYESPDDPFEKPDDIYAKGGVVLHMLASASVMPRSGPGHPPLHR